MPDLLASVMMITYNHEKNIAQAIESVLAQETDFPFELVIGEDCSTDGTRAIVEQYCQTYPERVRLVTGDVNVGMKKNALRTQAALRGRYMAYCEGDDFWNRPDKLQTQVAFLEAHPKVGLVHSDARILQERTGRTQVRRAGFATGPSRNGVGSEDLIAAMLLTEYDIITCTVCARKSLMDAIVADCQREFADPRFISMDRVRWLEMAQRAPMFCFDIPFATYRIQEESASRSQNPQRTLIFVRNMNLVRMHFVEKYGCAPALRKRVVRQSVDRLLRYAAKTDFAGFVQEATDELRRYQVAPTPTQRILIASLSNPTARKLLQPYFDLNLDSPLAWRSKLARRIRRPRQIASPSAVDSVTQ